MTELTLLFIGILVLDFIAVAVIIAIAKRHRHTWTKWGEINGTAYYGDGKSYHVTDQRRHCETCGKIQIRRVD